MIIRKVIWECSISNECKLRIVLHKDENPFGIENKKSKRFVEQCLSKDAIGNDRWQTIKHQFYWVAIKALIEDKNLPSTNFLVQEVDRYVKIRISQNDKKERHIEHLSYINAMNEEVWLPLTDDMYYKVMCHLVNQVEE